MITVKYPDGRETSHLYAVVSGDKPIGDRRPLPDGATLDLTEGCLVVTGGEAPERVSVAWPWARISELELGPEIENEEETVILRENQSVTLPF